MNPERHQRVMEILGEAIEREPESRDGWVDTVCAGDGALRAEVVRLLARQTSAAEFLEESPLAVAESNGRSMIGQHVGLYKIISEIGRGGMGAVYLAERDDQQFKKRVAVKLIKRGMDTDFVIQRFRNERQILANLDHPNIAKLLDGGATETDLPYFVMEYVEGAPIIAYANANQLNTTDRLKLFRTVCSAVQYAHQNLVIHRDLKPSNILVTKDGEPKLLDFGIAKLLQADGEAETELTATAVRVMTPEYASPEQVKGERISTSSDVYSLGVLLYELLTGCRPYRVKSRQPEEIARAICEQEPTKPSQAISVRSAVASESEPPAVAGGPKSQSAVGNPKLLRGDLDNIILKALRKEPQRRYASVEQFSEDIRRHLEGLPVTARKATFSYRTSKLIQRNKIGVAAAAIILLTLVGGIITTAWQAHRARIESVKAQQRFNEVRKLAHSVLFDYQDAVTPLAGSTQLRQLMVKDSLAYLDSLAKDAGGDLSLQREIGTAYQRIGDVQGGNLTSARGGTLSFSNLGDTKGALESYGKALVIRERLAALQPANVDVQQEWGTSITRLGELSLTLGKPADAIEHIGRALSIYEKLLAADPSNEVLRAKTGSLYFSVAKPLGIPGGANLGKDAEALANLQKALVAGQALATDYPNAAKYKQWVAAMFSNSGRVLVDEGKPTEALESYRKALPLNEALVKENGTNAFYRRELAIAYGNAGVVLLQLGNKQEALADCREAVRVLEALVAADPNDSYVRRDLAVNYRNLAEVLAVNGDRPGAGANFDQAAKILDELTTKDPTSALVSYQRGLTYFSLSTFLADGDDPSRAADRVHEAINLGEALIAIAPDNNSARHLLAQSYSQLGKCNALLTAKASTEKQPDEWREARDWYQKSLDIYQDMKSKETLKGADASKPDEIAREIAKCDEALKKLGTP